jgi:acyl-coenzyme A synthetase/AMP-(fatty) acid ligase
VFFAGEALTDALVADWRGLLAPGAQVTNLYGPTETTLTKCFYIVPDDPRPGIQPIGRPMPDCQALVLTKNNRLCGPGEAGEIVLRTPYATRGYIDRGEGKTPAFTPNPFSEDGDLVYRTGDIGRYLPDGTLEILGRDDDQVKIRGVRVEPSEVAAWINRDPAVTSSYVTGWTRTDGASALAAYLVLAPHAAPDVGPIRARLADLVSTAWIPESITLLEELPITANGKIDRSQLPAPHEIASVGDPGVQEARNPIEAHLITIWRDILDPAREFGIQDDFFAIGGNSLLAMRVANRIRSDMETEIPLRLLFQFTTPAALAGAIAEQGQA